MEDKGIATFKIDTSKLVAEIASGIQKFREELTKSITFDNGLTKKDPMNVIVRFNQIYKTSIIFQFLRIRNRLAQMLKRQYKLFKSVDEKIELTVLYNRENYKILTTFMMTEVTDFYSDVLEALENVISGNMEEYAFDGNLLGIEVGKEITEVYFQFEEEILGAPCFISTEELYKLVMEWKEMEERMKRGEDSFPVTIED